MGPSHLYMEAPTASPRTQESTAQGRSKTRDAAEIAVAYALILAVEWTARPLQRVLWMVAAAGIIAILCLSFDGWQAMGFRAVNLGRSYWIAVLALAIAVVAMAEAARMHTLRTPSGPFPFVVAYAAYALWAGVQQILLQGVFLLRFLRLFRQPALAALTASLLFAAAHLPNPVLTPLTFVWGLLACLLFLRYRTIYPLMIAHAVLGIAFAMTIPGTVDHNMRVGLGYLTYRPHSHLRPPNRLPQP